MSVPGYESYRDSGVEWLGEVPSHWEVKALKRGLRLITERTDRRSWAVGLENIEGWSGRLVETDATFEGEGVGFEAGDLLYGKLRPYLAKVYVAERPGEAVGDFHVLRSEKAVFPQFAAYQLRTHEVVSQLNGSTFGARMPRVGWEFMGGLPLAFPPLEEQTAIAAFLDRETGKIDALVEAQRRLIELLKEKRQAVISHAVTKGLAPAAPMKDSGVEWLGEVPAHWEVSRLARFSERVVVGIAEAAVHAYAPEGVPILRSMNVRRGRIIGDLLYVLPEYAEERGSKMILAGDIITVRTGHAGVSAVIPPELSGCQCFTMLVTTPGASALSSFMCEYLNSAPAVFYFSFEAWGAAQPNISVPILRDLPMPLPPIEEQREIAAHIQSVSAQMDALTTEAEAAISLLQERRAALISAAVTGKIDVRDLVADQPERDAA